MTATPASVVAQDATDTAGARGEPTNTAQSRLGAMSLWDDGMAEMCYYDATKTIYGQPRKYTAVHIFIREYMDPDTGVKADDPHAAGVIPVFKLNICEEVPTENYNYRLMTSLFLDRRDLRPVKAVSSSQEWCGTTFKHLRWRGNALSYESFSYFEGEADNARTLPAATRPFEAAFVIARELVANPGFVINDAKQPTLPPLRSNHAAPPDAADGRFEVGAETTVRVPAGAFKVRPVTLTRADREYRFWIETASSHRLIKYDFGDETGELRFQERRAYWDRDWKSGFHPPSEAP